MHEVAEVFEGQNGGRKKNFNLLLCQERQVRKRPYKTGKKEDEKTHKIGEKEL
jgi:hypothetical protein